jgi:hypothetical protein
MNSKDKGNRLEDAIENIERLYIRNIIDSTKSEILIERNKRSKQNGVGDEADLLITINRDTAYEAKFIFECKNWKKKVEKAEVIVFREKVRVHGATKGFLVGKKFNSGAISQAKNSDGKVELIQFDDNIQNIYNEVGIDIIPKNLGAEIFIYVSKADGSIDLMTDSHNYITLSDGQKMSDKDLIDQYIREEKSSKALEEELLRQLENIDEFGFIPYELDLVISFPNEFSFKGNKYVDLKFKLKGRVFKYQVKLVSRFDVSKRGRDCRYEYIDEDGVLQKISKVETVVNKKGQIVFAFGNGGEPSSINDILRQLGDRK